MEMAVAVLSTLTSNVVPKLAAVLEKRNEQLKGLEGDIHFMKIELEMISGAMELQLSQKQRTSPVQIRSMAEFRDLAHDIEDCLDRFLPCAACEGEPPASIRDPRRFADKIKKLKAQLEAAKKRKVDYDVNGSQASGATEEMDTEELVEEADDPVGIEKPKQEILDLLEGGEQEKLCVVSIVGFGGSGKTALAWEVYHCTQVSWRFGRRAWAVASKHKDAKGLLTAILEGLRSEEEPAMAQDVPGLQQHIRNHLKAARCLIVIDDIRKQLWNAIKPIFSVETRSRILVTTSIQSVANACSSGHGYVYSMKTLSAEHSKDLLNKKVFVGGCSPDMEEGSTAIVDKCDGLPLALVSVAKVLQGENMPTGACCQEISQNLGERTDKNKNGDFTQLRQVLMSSYSSLPDPVNPLRTCLLYTSLFPDGRPFSRNRLIRRLSAEGYIQRKHPCVRGDLDVADENLKELIDRSIIRPIDVSNNAKVKTCRTHSIMHQFMLHKSRSSNFITAFGASNSSNFRHLVIQNHKKGTEAPPDMNDHLSIPVNGGHSWTSVMRFTKKSSSSDESKQLRPRSLTVFGSAGDAVSGLSNCELLRVLDLNECDDLKDEHLKCIYKLLHLKYLSLGRTVCNLSRKMERLHCLETLDLRKTRIETLPVQVLRLPHLAHLFGKVKLELPIKLCAEDMLKQILPRETKLETLAGFITDKNYAFPQLMCLLKKLRKVKIWCEPTSTDCNLRLLSEAIQKFVLADMVTGVGSRSLSLHLNNYSEDLLHHLDNTAGYLSSLKLHGKLTRFPQFVLSLCGLKELCLILTNLKGSDLSNLLKLRNLLYLKLVGVDHLNDLHINRGDLSSLRRLCLVVETPEFPRIGEGALLTLTSLQLLCQGLVGLCGIELGWFIELQEVALDSMVNTETIQDWENAAKKHPRRPKVLLLKRVDQAETGSTVKYVATEGPSIFQKKRNIEQFQSTSTYEVQPNLKQLKI